jgi:predicted ATPase
MIRRFYVHNFRCLENFELDLAGHSSVLLIGKNGAGKTTVGFALEILQKIARGNNRVSDLVKPQDLTQGRAQVPMRFEIEVELSGRVYEYAIAFDFPEGSRELRVYEEKLTVQGKSIYSRQLAQVHLARMNQDKEARFRIDWHLVALPIVQENSETNPSFLFKQWLGRMLVLRPIPSLIKGDSQDETLQPDAQMLQFSAWFSGLLGYAFSAYAKIDEFLKQLMPDFIDIKNPTLGKDSKSLVVHFANGTNGQQTLKLPFEELSDGEKCFMICAVVLASNDAYGPLVCFWDEPDNYLAPSEVGHFVIALRKEFLERGQFIATSHNFEAISRFSQENTLVLYRRNHLEPTLSRPLDQFQVDGDPVEAFVRGDI